MDHIRKLFEPTEKKYKNLINEVERMIRITTNQISFLKEEPLISTEDLENSLISLKNCHKKLNEQLKSEINQHFGDNIQYQWDSIAKCSCDKGFISPQALKDHQDNTGHSGRFINEKEKVYLEFKHYLEEQLRSLFHYYNIQ